MALRFALRRLSATTLVPARRAVPRRVLPSARRALAAPPSTPDDEDDDAAARDESLEDAFGAMYAWRPPGGAGSGRAGGRRRGRPLPQTTRS